jgi:hypothetical protein
MLYTQIKGVLSITRNILQLEIINFIHDVVALKNIKLLLFALHSFFCWCLLTCILHRRAKNAVNYTASACSLLTSVYWSEFPGELVPQVRAFANVIMRLCTENKIRNWFLLFCWLCNSRRLFNWSSTFHPHLFHCREPWGKFMTQLAALIKFPGKSKLYIPNNNIFLIYNQMEDSWPIFIQPYLV